jgi:DNA-binding LacI/PurR family transcriptional regulator
MGQISFPSNISVMQVLFRFTHNTTIFIFLQVIFQILLTFPLSSCKLHSGSAHVCKEEVLLSITIKDIARQAGVSHSTVSRALRGSPLISDETSRRIHQIAGELGYFPSGPARSLKTNRSRALGVIVNRIDDPFYSEILQGIEEAAQERGYSLVMAASQRDPGREKDIIRGLRERRVDGVIICSGSFNPGQQREMLDYGIPIVIINNQSTEYYRYSVYHDDIDGSRQVTRHLIKLGHRKIAYLGNSLSGRTTLDRQRGFQEELKASGLTVPAEYIHQVPGGSPEQGLQGVQHYLDLPEVPTALFCFNDLLALGVLKGLRQAGLAVPDDISVAGFDNIELSFYTTPPLTTLDQPKWYIGSQAAGLILNLLVPPDGHKPPEQAIQILKGKLLVRESTAAPPPVQARA